MQALIVEWAVLPVYLGLKCYCLPLAKEFIPQVGSSHAVSMALRKRMLLVGFTVLMLTFGATTSSYAQESLEPQARQTADGGTNSPDDGPHAVAEASYPIDPARLREEFADTSSLKVQVPREDGTLHTITIRGTVNDFIRTDEVVIIGENRSDVIERRPIIAVPIEGYVEGSEASRALVTITHEGLDGRIVMDDARFEFQSFQDGESERQRVERWQASQPSQGRMATSPASSGSGFGTLSHHLTESQVAYHYELGAGVYSSEVVASHNLMIDLWEYMGIDLTIGDMTGSASSMTSAADCFDARDEYIEWLDDGNEISGIDSYQHWRDYDFSGSTIGCSFGDTIWSGTDSASMIQLDSATGYNPGSATHRSLLAAHEFGHVYGEDNEVDGCQTNWYDCNIMKQTLVTWLDFWWTSSSVDEVFCRFYYDAEETC